MQVSPVVPQLLAQVVVKAAAESAENAEIAAAVVAVAVAVKADAENVDKTLLYTETAGFVPADFLCYLCVC